MRLIRLPEESNEDFLFKIYNKYGFKDLRIAGNYIVNDELVWTTRIKFEDLIHLPSWQWVKGTFNQNTGNAFRKDEFLNIVKHRSVMDIEIMLDIDEENTDFLEFDDIKQKAEFISKYLKDEGWDIVIHSAQSKSYHISYLDPKLRDYDIKSISRNKERIIRFFNTDMQMSGPKSMIALEGVNHYKSGLQKQKVEL